MYLIHVGAQIYKNGPYSLTLSQKPSQQNVNPITPPIPLFNSIICSVPLSVNQVRLNTQQALDGPSDDSQQMLGGIGHVGTSWWKVNFH